MILPFAFVFNPALLMHGVISVIIREAVFAVFAVNALGYGLRGWCYRKVNILFRILMFLMVILLLSPMPIPGYLSIVLYIVLVLYMRKSSQNLKTQEEGAEI
jgi:TRAP-type uncharacterized transport system fused permease subunit